MKAFQKYRLIYKSPSSTQSIWICFLKKYLSKKKKKKIWDLSSNPFSLFNQIMTPITHILSHLFIFTTHQNPKQSINGICVCNPTHLFCYIKSYNIIMIYQYKKFIWIKNLRHFSIIVYTKGLASKGKANKNITVCDQIQCMS